MDLQSGIRLSPIGHVCVGTTPFCSASPISSEKYGKLPADVPCSLPHPARRLCDGCSRPAPAEAGHRTAGRTARPPRSAASTGFLPGRALPPAGRADKLPLRGGRHPPAAALTRTASSPSAGQARAGRRRRQRGPGGGKALGVPQKEISPRAAFVAPFLRVDSRQGRDCRGCRLLHRGGVCLARAGGTRPR